MREGVLVLLWVLLATPAVAQVAEKPKVAANDEWTYQSTQEKGTAWHQTNVEQTVVRAEADDILLSIKEVGSPAPPHEQLVGSDWSRFRSVDGRDTVVNRPFDFPLAPGKTWQVEYKDDHPSDRAHSSEQFDDKYRVTGWEDVTVPAGTFRALKVECEGKWTAVLAPSVGAVSGSRVSGEGSTVVMQTNRVTPQTITGRLYKAFWYVPEVKRFVKTDEEYFSSNGQRSERDAEDLESYHVSP
jgi:hypothetical protein